jgi:hypothetical protein
MKILKIDFSKNGLEYRLMKRNDKVALFQLGPTEYPDEGIIVISEILKIGDILTIQYCRLLMQKNGRILLLNEKQGHNL